MTTSLSGFDVRMNGYLHEPDHYSSREFVQIPEIKGEIVPMPLNNAGPVPRLHKIYRYKFQYMKRL